MYYSSDTQSTANSKGIIGTLTSRGFEWSETLGIQAPAVASGFNAAGREKMYHGDRGGYIYNHDTGNSFNPVGSETNISAEFQSPDFDYGDFGTLKTLDHIKVSINPEGEVEPTLRVRFDYDSTDRLTTNRRRYYCSHSFYIWRYRCSVWYKYFWCARTSVS